MGEWTAVESGDVTGYVKTEYILTGAEAQMYAENLVTEAQQEGKEEAEAFLALMQLRQLRKAWICDWEQPNSHSIVYVIKYDLDTNKVRLASGNFWGSCTLSFPILEMAKEFLNCFRDLCETAKILL